MRFIPRTEVGYKTRTHYEKHQTVIDRPRRGADVYLSFSESGSFDIYQRLYKPEYVHLDGTYSYDKPTLSGRYSDNTPWGSASYRVSFNADGTRMTLTSTSSTSDVSVFVKAEIPSEIISGALESTPQSRAEDMPRFL